MFMNSPELPTNSENGSSKDTLSPDDQKEIKLIQKRSEERGVGIAQNTLVGRQQSFVTFSPAKNKSGGPKSKIDAVYFSPDIAKKSMDTLGITTLDALTAPQVIALTMVAMHFESGKTRFTLSELNGRMGGTLANSTLRKACTEIQANFLGPRGLRLDLENGKSVDGDPEAFSLDYGDPLKRSVDRYASFLAVGALEESRDVVRGVLSVLFHQHVGSGASVSANDLVDQMKISAKVVKETIDAMGVLMKSGTYGRFSWSIAGDAKKGWHIVDPRNSLLLSADEPSSDPQEWRESTK